MTNKDATTPLTLDDIAEILSRTLDIIQAEGLTIKTINRADGLIVFVEGLRIDDGRVMASEKVEAK